MIYVFDWFCFDGCCVLIIGFGCGIGLMFVCGFVEVGVVIVINDCNEEKVVMFVCWFCDEGFVVDYVVFDVVEYVQVCVVIDEFEVCVGVIDIFVNNVGIQCCVLFDVFELDDWYVLMCVNFDGVFNVVQVVVWYMIVCGYGKIINICLVQSEFVWFMIVLYVVIKGVVWMLIKGMCVDWVCYGIQVNGFVFGYFEIELNCVLVDDVVFFDWLCKCMFVGCWGQVDELCGVVIFFVLVVFDFVNGQMLFVDGGLISVV